MTLVRDPEQHRDDVGRKPVRLVHCYIPGSCVALCGFREPRLLLPAKPPFQKCVVCADLNGERMS